MIVIGAGVAGLAAAQDLKLAGQDVLVLEARDRIGGRIHTLRPPDWPLPVEAGAEFVHGLPRELLPYAQKRKELPPGHYTDVLRKRDDLWQSVMEKLGKLPSGRERSMQQAFSTLRWRLRTSAEERQLAAAFVEGFNAARLDEASLKGIAQQTKASGEIEGDRIARLPQGFDDVARKLAKGLRIELNTIVREVRWQNDHVTLITNRGRYDTPKVIVTLPLGVLQGRDVRFTPALPQWKRRAIAALAMGPVTKIALLFDRPHWPDDLVFLHARGAPVPTFWRMLPSQAPALMGWAASRCADRLAKRNAVAAAVDSLAFALGKRVRPRAAMVFDWQRDPFSRGAYSWVPAGSLKAQRALAKGVGPLFFAGEATHFGGACGTVHGAIETGRRAAGEALG